MALYEFFCERCSLQFEAITCHSQIHEVRCEKCGKSDQLKRMISAFKVAGRGDLREHTLHGCHEAHVEGGDEGDSHE